jgi:organic hydroperoxide reductase OsmC/OhrA
MGNGQVWGFLATEFTIKTGHYPASGRVDELF